ncbi:S-adenosyl-L-methionine-dependent methyltransferase [Gracilaria domingensis]|nr:S-adenosyl-L-methionine-dependent methyltransferase [Gracilaria domingensis]
MGWRGICVEANSQYYERLHTQRSCHLVPTCASDEDEKDVQFGMLGANGGILETYTGDARVLEGVAEELSCTTLETIFHRMGVSHVDYLNLDVEGHELEVLEGVEWGKVIIDIITVENEKHARNPIHTFLLQRGYHAHVPGRHAVRRMKPFRMKKVVYVRHGVVLGFPE